MPAIPEERIRALTDKYLTNSLTESENQELNDLGILYPGIWKLINLLQDDEQLIKELQQRHAIDTDRARAKLWVMLDAEEKAELPLIQRIPSIQRTVRKWMVAAAIFLLSGTGIYLFFQGKTNKAGKEENLVSSGDISPGSDKAILTLADGRTIRLDSMQAGKVIEQAGSSIRKESSGSVTYILSSTPIQEGPGGLNESKYGIVYYNTLTTPRSGQFAVSLPDGTKVWMNNASSLIYPTVFRGKSREVSFSGEGHFEVAENASQPFRVKVDDLAVNVLGTSFAIMAYKDETEISTTLLDGKVKLDNGVNTQVMTKGERMIIAEGKPWKRPERVNTDEAIAWEKGMFQFAHANLETVLRQLARWYNVDPEVRGEIPQHKYDILVSRENTLSETLKAIPHEDIQFRIEGKKLIVTKR